MRKIGVLLLFVLGILFMNFVIAANCTSFTYSNWSTCSSGIQTRVVANSTPVNCTGGSPILSQNCTSTTSTTNLSNIEKGFKCLETQTRPDCSGAQSVQEIALTIIASPNNTEACVTRLRTFEKTNCFGDSSCDIRDTALAIIALDHVGETTTKYESWLQNQTQIATDLIWYLEQDSLVKSNCEITYDSQQYPFIVEENKKISVPAGSCLSLTQSNYWFSVSPSCYDKEFSLVCDQSFIGTLMYKQPSSQTLHVLSDTKSSAPNTPISLKIKSTCFGEGSCDYEASAWAALALDRTGNDISAYIPYMVAMEQANENYLPQSFLHMLVDYSEYGSKLIQLQQLNYWEAENTAYDKYYDTALALIALSGSSQQQVTTSKNWLSQMAQESDGCWNNKNVRDTAIALWALSGRVYTIVPRVTTTYCTEANFFCVPSSQCASDMKLSSSNYYCASLSQVCCRESGLESCAEKDGTVCSADKECSGIEEQASDTSKCCLAECEEASVGDSCTTSGGSCMTSCGSTKTEVVGATCESSSKVCCKANSSTPNNSDEQGSLWWLWLILIILIILLVLGYIFRNQIRALIYKRKSGFGEDNHTTPSGFPPSGSAQMQRPMMQRPVARGPGPGMPPPRQMPPGQIQPGQQQMSRPPLRR